jgi:hypothetical protein
MGLIEPIADDPIDGSRQLLEPRTVIPKKRAPRWRVSGTPVDSQLAAEQTPTLDEARRC